MCIKYNEDLLRSRVFMGMRYILGMHEWRGIVFWLLLDASTIPLSRVLLCVVRHYEYRNNVSFLSTDPMQPNQRSPVVSHADRLFQMLNLHKTQRTEAL